MKIQFQLDVLDTMVLELASIAAHHEDLAGSLLQRSWSASAKGGSSWVSDQLRAASNILAGQGPSLRAQSSDLRNRVEVARSATADWNGSITELRTALAAIMGTAPATAGGGAALGASTSGHMPSQTGSHVLPADFRGVPNLPFVSQWAFDRKEKKWTGGGNCGPASLAMILGYYGKNVQFEDVVNKIPKVQFPDGTWGTNFESGEAQSLLKENGLDYVRDAQGNILNVGSLDELKAQLNAGHPVILAVNNGYGVSSLYKDVKDMGDKPHIVVVTGYGTDASGHLTVYINDPLAITKTLAKDPSTGTNYPLPVGGSSGFIAAADGGGSNGRWYGAAVIRLPAPPVPTPVYASTPVANPSAKLKPLK